MMKAKFVRGASSREEIIDKLLDRIITGELPSAELLGKKSIKESANFIRGIDPKRALEIGLPPKMGEGYTVLWRDRRNKWSIERYTNPHTKEPDLVIVSDEYVDWPILYSDGRIAYDNPYRLPKLIRDKAHKLYLQIKGFNESVNFNRGADPKKTLEIGEYRPHIVKFNDYDGEVQTIKVQKNSFKLSDNYTLINES